MVCLQKRPPDRHLRSKILPGAAGEEVDFRAPAILEVSRQFGENTNLDPEAFSGTPHVLEIAVSQKQQFLEHAGF